jgi:3-oxoacyl-[acyl-carrier-protein] synthase III
MGIGIRVKSLVSVVPERKLGVDDLVTRFGEETAAKIILTTGVNYRHVSEDKKTLDLSLEAGRCALEKAGVEPADVDGIIMVTQTPEYRLPSTSCILQDRLGLRKTAFALDIGLGCSGFPYGMITAASLIGSGVVSRMLLISGDVTSMNATPEDKSTYPLFADGFGAALLEGCSGTGDLLGYDFGTDGSGWKNLIIHAGLARHPKVEHFYSSGEDKLFPEVKYPGYAYMDGGQVFTFCLREVPSMIDRALAKAGLNRESIDAYLFHQANLFIIRYLGQKMKIPESKIPVCLDRYGNTSSSSVVLAACDRFGGMNNSKLVKVAFAAFGVGYSWATVVLTLDPAVVASIKEV